jgi:peptidoglycan/xylan/chitin deacetylase (PgdA/CDA1 family)
MLKKVGLGLFLLFTALACQTRTAEAQHVEQWAMPLLSSRPADTYCAAPGDTLAGIAASADVSEANLRTENGIGPDDRLFLGQLLHLPLGALPPNQWPSPLPTEALSLPMQLATGQSGVYLSTNNRLRRVALTFDIGYNPANVELMEYLAERDAPSTFFLVGAHPQMVQAVLANGHELANHSWSHADLTQLSEAAVREEIARPERITGQQVTGATMRPFLRAPFGAINATVRQVAAEEGFTLVGWTIDSGDWQPGATTQQIVDNVTSQLCPGAIIVMHGSQPHNRAAVPPILDYLEQAGYQAVTLSELLTPLATAEATSGE